RPGDHVIIQRSGDVIPEVVRVLTEKRSPSSRPWHMPKKCPECGTELVWEPGEAATRCINPTCPAQVLEHFRHFVGSLDIEGLGYATLQQLIDRKLVKDPADLYHLTKEQLLALTALRTNRRRTCSTASPPASRRRSCGFFLRSPSTTSAGRWPACWPITSEPSTGCNRPAWTTSGPSAVSARPWRRTSTRISSGQDLAARS